VAGNTGQAGRPARPVPRAAQLADEAVTLIPAALDAPEWAEFLVAKAEVARLAGALGEAEAGLRRALQFYQGRQMVPLAEQPCPARRPRRATPHPG
jgi:hypothetical protein